ncbi:TSUP family transporter [Terrimonas rubra]|uniref:Probable membrane transporter protein n=1 Tax=Terrimonas rubra TaxID=1035890 RepID=A0ABW6A8T5_9BACT
MSVVTKDITEKNEQVTNELFPVFLKLDHLKVLLVGAGKIGLEKVTALLQNSPRTTIKVVAKEVTPAFRAFTEGYDNVRIEERGYEATDLEACDVAIVAANDKILSQAIFTAARQQNKLINVADTPEYCDFYLGSIVKKGNLKIAISTNGKSPTMAKRIKEVLNDALPQELNDSIDNLHKVRNKLNGNFEYKVKKLNKLTKVLLEDDTAFNEKKWRRIATYSLLAFGLMLVGHFTFTYIIPFESIKNGLLSLYSTLDASFLVMFAAGFFAQLVDGALGMGYGVVSATVLLSAGVSPAAISGSIHTAEMFASGASGYSHYKFGNVNKKLFKALVLPGVIGAVAGAWLLYYLGEEYSNLVRPILACYTLLLGIKILYTAYQNQIKKKKFKHYKALAGAGGFFDSFGGGGWGPIVTTTLITKGRSPKYVIGSVSITEFFVTLSSALTFFLLLGVTHWQTILGLIVGGLVAAPIAARLVGKLPRRTALILVGVLVIVWSVRILIKVL